MFAELHVLDDPEPRSAALNMAIDEALLADSDTLSLRYYRWLRPSVSFGYFGSYAHAAGERGESDIVRRWTGGGLVHHGEDLTYSLVIPFGHPFLMRGSIEIYSSIHEAIRRTFNAEGIDVILADRAAPSSSANCFSSPVRADVMFEGRKIAGAAHRKTRAGLLHQGSIQDGRLFAVFRERFAKILCPTPTMKSVPLSLLERATAIAAKKYGTEEWLRRR